MEGCPRLTEPGIRSFVIKSLRDQHNFRDSVSSLVFNIVMLFIFVALMGGVLYWRYKGRITPQEQSRKNRIKKEYILSKLQTLAAAKKQNRPGMITNLPTWNDHPELDVLGRKNV
jgi:hypothetical protein